MKLCFLLFALSIQLHLGVNFAQSDSINIEFYKSDPVLLNADDSAQYGFGVMSNYYVDFLASEINAFSKIYIEMSDESGENILYTLAVTPTELLSVATTNGNTIKLFLGMYENFQIYKLSIITEDSRGTLGKVFTKMVQP